jgi:hypothetical protein
MFMDIIEIYAEYNTKPINVGYSVGKIKEFLNVKAGSTYSKHCALIYVRSGYVAQLDGTEALKEAGGHQPIKPRIYPFPTLRLTNL